MRNLINAILKMILMKDVFHFSFKTRFYDEFNLNSIYSKSKVSNKRTVQCTLINIPVKSSLHTLIKDLPTVPTPLNFILDGQV